MKSDGKTIERAIRLKGTYHVCTMTPVELRILMTRYGYERKLSEVIVEERDRQALADHERLARLRRRK